MKNYEQIKNYAKNVFPEKSSVVKNINGHANDFCVMQKNLRQILSIHITGMKKLHRVSWIGLHCCGIQKESLQENRFC